MIKRKSPLLLAFGALVLVACGSSSLPISSSSSSSSLPPSSTSVSSEDPNADLPLANGLFNYTAADYDEKAEILGQLEKWAQDEFLAGIPMYDSGGNVLYNGRLTIPSDVFIPNYGFGVGEGTINYPMTAAQEPVAAYRSYYHAWTQNEPTSINYMDAQDAVTSDFYALISSSYYGTRFTADKSAYEWFPSLATGFPVALNLNSSTGMATRWRVPVRTDAAMVYSTLSTVPAIAAFNGRRVALADYLTPFKLMLDNQWFRATDLGSATSGFKGVSAYSRNIAAGRPADWSTVGIQLNAAENAIEFEFNVPKTAFYAMYNLSTTLFSPIPESFISTIGGPANFGKKNINSTLSLGVYTMEEWQETKQVVFKKNASYYQASRYNYAGYMYTIIAAGANVAFDEFLSGKLDAVGVPAARIKEFKSDPRRRVTFGDTVFKLQTNATTQERWEELFGENGSILQTAPENYWDVKPVMSNKNFLNGLYFAIDRINLADQLGRNPAQAFLSDSYMIDPENGVSYRSSDAGKASIADRLPETKGYSEELAKALFVQAMNEEVAAGHYVRGTTASPTVITLKIHWQTAVSATTDGAIIKSFFEDAFNEAVEGFQLVIDNFATANWYDVYYNSMMTGQFDFAMGAISGSPLDPLNFMEVLTSDNRTGFTLSWGADTAVPSQGIRYDGKAWSYNALFAAANGGTVAEDGASATLLTMGPHPDDADLVYADELYPEVDPITGKYTVRLVGTWFNELPGEVEIDFFEVLVIDYWKQYRALPGVYVASFPAADVVTKNSDGTFSITLELDIPFSNPYPADYYGFIVQVQYVVTIQGVSTPAAAEYWFYSPIAPV